MQTHEITGYDDTWEYATTTVTGGNPPRIIQHPPGEGWVIDDAPQNQRDRYRWKRPIGPTVGVQYLPGFKNEEK